MLFIYACQGNVTTDEKAEKTDKEDLETTDFIYLDAVEVAHEHYTLLSDDGSVRVVEMHLPPGERDKEHSHNWETVYFISGGAARVYIGDEVVEKEIPDGFVMHHEPWTHSVENIGDTDIRAIIFERMEETVYVEYDEGYIDAAEAAHEHYTVLSEEGNVRVLHMLMKPGDRDNKHSHYYETVYFLSGGKARIYVGDEVVEKEIPDGFVMHHEPWTHSIVNIGETNIEAIIYELMPPSDGDEYTGY